MTLGEKIRTRRKSIRMKAEDLAGALGIKKGTLYKYESGDITRIPQARLRAMAEILDVPYEYLAEADRDGDSFAPVRVSRMDGTPYATVGIPRGWTDDGREYRGIYIDESHFGPYVPVGTIVIIRTVSSFQTGQTVVIGVSVGNRKTVHIGKAVRNSDGRVLVFPINPTQPVSVVEPESIGFIGVLVETRRSWDEIKEKK